jgi:hypothetical protein
MTTETEAIQRAVSAIIRHRNFDQNTYNHDIALLRLRKPVTFTKSIQPICLPKESIDPSGKVATGEDVTNFDLVRIILTKNLSKLLGGEEQAKVVHFQEFFSMLTSLF